MENNLILEEIALLPIFERRRDIYRQKASELESLRQNERSEIWAHGDDLINGLPDELVETFIWPRVVKYVEEVKEVDQLIPAIKERIETIRSLCQTSRRWRHIVRNSKPWGGVRLIMEFWNPHSWENYPEIVTNDFCSIMMYLPPLDIFCRSTIDFLKRWFSAWTHIYLKSEREFYLELYPDPLDVWGRVTRWKEWRNTGLMAPLAAGIAELGTRNY